MRISNGVCVETRDRVWIDGDPELAREFFLEVKATKAGKQYFSDFASAANHEKVIEAVWKLHPNIEYVTVNAFVDAIATLRAAGELTPTHEPELAAPAVASVPVPVDRNGRPLSAAQIKWGEFSRWSEAPTTSSAMIKERCRTDEEYARFHTSCLKKAMIQPIDGDARPLNPHLEKNSTPTTAALKNNRLVEFANNYRRMSAEEVRKARRLDINPLSAKQFCADMDEAIRQNLL